MKWLKLDCDFRYDPKILALGKQFGAGNACAFWVLLLGYVGKYGMPECLIEINIAGQHSPAVLAEFLYTYHQKTLAKMLQCCADLRLISPESWDNLSGISPESSVNLRESFWNGRKISIPNMLKRVDDYTRKVRTLSVQTPNLPPTEQNKIENRLEEKREPLLTTHAKPKPYSEEFERFWNAYPRRVGKGAAWVAWRKNHRPPLPDLLAAVQRAIESFDWQRDAGQFIPHPSTWLNQHRWEDEGLIPMKPKSKDIIV